MIKFKKLNLKTTLYLGSILLLLVSVFILAQMVLAQEKLESSQYKIKDLFVEIQRIDSFHPLYLVKEEGNKKEVIGQAKIVDQYLISDIEENEFLEEFPELKKSFLDLKIDIESNQPIFKKENFYHLPSLLEKAKSLFGFKTLPEYRIIKEINPVRKDLSNGAESIQTNLDFSKISLTVNYQKLETQFPLSIKQTIILTNNSEQDFNLSLLLKNRIDADRIYWDKKEYLVSENPQKFGNPDKISFYTEDGKLSFYDYSDISEEFSPELWVERQNSQSFFILSLNIFVPAHSSKTIDPIYSIELTILNVHSHPQAGAHWTVSFETKGTADLTITPNDQQTIDDLDFVSLACDSEERTPQILEGDVIFYPNWQCNEIGEITHLVNVARGHILKFQFGYQIAYAYNSPDSTVYDFSSGTSSNKWAYYGKDDPNDVPVAVNRSTWLVAGTEFTNDYARVAISDDSRATTTDTATTSFKQLVHDFVITISEATDTIDSIDLYWEGYSEQNQEDAAENDLRMYLYNVSSTVWELVDSELNDSCPGASDCTMTYTATSATYFSEYINASGILRYLVQKFEEGDCCCDSSGTCFTEASDSPYNTGCTYQTNAQDLWSECGTTSCGTGNCDGSGYLCGLYKDDAQHNCNTCYACDGSGNCTARTVDYAAATALGCTDGEEACRRCNAGSCTYYTSGQHQCAPGYECDFIGRCIQTQTCTTCCNANYFMIGCCDTSIACKTCGDLYTHIEDCDTTCPAYCCCAGIM